jgi:hypothetical protein
MCSGEKARYSLGSWLKNWYFSSIDAEGLSGGIITGWSLDFMAINSSVHGSTIAVSLKHKNMDKILNFINIYGPYTNRIMFWEDIIHAGVLSKPQSIIRGDFNFTVSLREVWGSNPRPDGQRDFFISLMEDLKLVDIEPIKVIPTWSNGRSGQETIAKCLD